MSNAFKSRAIFLPARAANLLRLGDTGRARRSKIADETIRSGSMPETEKVGVDLSDRGLKNPVISATQADRFAFAYSFRTDYHPAERFPAYETWKN